jgi:hypothetical protein
MSDNTQPTTPDDVMTALADQDVDSIPSTESIGDETADDVLSTEGKKRLGSLVITTTGSPSTLQVPHEELRRKMMELGFPENAVPERTPPRKAFTRAKNQLLSEYTGTTSFDGREVSFDVWNDGRYLKYVVANFIADSSGETVTLGTMRFDPDEQDIVYHMHSDVAGTSLEDAWKTGFVQSMDELFAHHQTHVNAQDISRLGHLLHEKVEHSIKLRRAVYFYPSTSTGLDGVMESFRRLYQWLDANYKVKGESTEFYWTPLFSRDADKEFIGKKLEEHLEEEIEGLIEDVAEAISDENTSERVARDILEPALGRLDSTAREYEAISETTPKVRRMFRKAVRDTDTKAAERARRVIEAAEKDTDRDDNNDDPHQQVELPTQKN